MHTARELVRKLGWKAPQQVVDEIQAAIREGQSETELNELARRLGYVQDILDKESSTAGATPVEGRQRARQTG